MNKHINLEDNIFLINTRIRMIRDLLILDTDPDLFLEKTMDDLDFIDNTMAVLMENLIQNKRLIDRDEQFHILSETEQLFFEVLSELSTGENEISSIRYPVIQGKVAALRTHSLERRRTIDDSITGEDNTVASMEPVVSPDELNELLKTLD
jgi:hypothetical protein